MSRVVLVHGIAQEQLSADSLEKDWIPALAGGVRNAGYPAISDALYRGNAPGPLVRMAFYGDLFLRPDEQGTSVEVLSEAQEAASEKLAEEWLERAATRSSNAEERAVAARELVELRGSMGREEQSAGRIARKAVRRISKIRWFAPYGMAFAQRFVNKALAQVTDYFARDDVRTIAVQRVLALIDRDIQVVIAHSLGSVVAFEALHKVDHPIELLVTAGSPLGLDSFVYPRLRPQPPIFPASVRRWVNVVDPNDFIASEPDLTKFFSEGIPSGAEFVGLRTVKNGALPHSAEFYLNQKQVGEFVGRALQG